MKRLLYHLLTFTALLTAPGCSETPTDPPDLGALPSLAAGRQPTFSDVRLPLDEYGFGSDLPLVRKAVDLLARKCMQEIGLDVAIPYSTGQISPLIAQANGWLDETNAAHFGYRLAADGVDVRAAIKSSMRPDPEGKVWFGEVTSYRGRQVPEHGCHGQASQRIFGQQDEFTIIDQITFAASSQASSDPSVRRAERQWSACMRRTGHRYDTPREAATDPRWSRFTSSTANANDTPRVSREQIATAVADARCRTAVSYFGVNMAVKARLQKALIAGHTRELLALKKRTQESVQRAKQVLNELGAS